MSGTAQRILIVDDNADMLDLCAETLGQLEVECVTERDPRRAAELLKEESFDALVADIRMAGMDGVTLLKIAREHDPNLQVIMLTGHPTTETAVECLKLGEADYITKPVNPDDFLARVRRCLEERRLREEHSLLKRQVEKEYAFSDLVGTSPAMREVMDVVARVAATDVDVLILGETGTGKELVARDIP
jgi:DNA-binding NtrC family response regulator